MCYRHHRDESDTHRGGESIGNLQINERLFNKFVDFLNCYRLVSYFCIIWVAAYEWSARIRALLSIAVGNDEGLHDV